MQVSDWSATTLQSVDLSLYVYESVELDLGFEPAAAALDKNGKRRLEYPISLHPDLTSPARYVL